MVDSVNDGIEQVNGHTVPKLANALTLVQDFVAMTKLGLAYV
jgi:hypothetical protein